MFAMHRHHDPDPTSIDEVAARETVVDLIVNSLIPSRSPARRPGKA